MTAPIDPWRIEEACRRAWPAAEERLVEGWLARSSGGPFRRLNSATPGQQAASFQKAFPAIAKHYAALGREVVLRLPDFADTAVEADLEGLGPPEAWTDTLIAPLSNRRSSSGPARLDARPTGEWLAARALLAGEAPEAAALTARLIGTISDPVAFASIEREGRIVSVALAVIAEGLVVFEAVRTDPEWQGRGLARDCMIALLNWAGETGAEAAALQVVQDNLPAQRLYAGLGFTTCVYRYCYRRPLGGGT